MPDVVEDLEPQTDASTSPEIPERFADDTSVDTGAVEAVPEPVEVETETEEVTDKPESEADSSPAVEEDHEEKTEPQPGDIEYTEAVKERMDELTAYGRETERALEAANLEREDLRRQLAERPVQQAPLKTPADFDYDDGKYQEYIRDENAKAAATAAEQAVLRVQRDAARKERDLEIAARETKYAEKHKDYFKVTRDPNLRISLPMLDAAAESDIREDVLLHLAKNPDKAMTIYNLPDAQAGYKMGLLSAELKAQQAKANKPKEVSKAPPPVPKIKSGDAAVERGYTEGMTDKQFAKARAKEIANR